MLTDRKFHWVALLFIVAACGRAQAQTAPSAAAIIRRVDVGGENGAATVRVSGEGALTVRTVVLTAPDRLVLDFSNARLGVVPATSENMVGPVRGIRTGQFKPDVARVVVDLEGAAAFRIEADDGSVTVVFGAVTGKTEQVASASNGPAAEVMPAPAHAVQPPTPAGGPPEAESVATGIANNPPNSFQNGLLTFTAKNRPLDLVLADIGEITNVPIVMAEGVGDEQVSEEFRSYRLDEALQQILKNYDVLFSYGGSNDGQGNPTLRTVWVYLANQGPGMGRFAMEAWNSTGKQYTQTMAVADPDQRAAAVDELIRRDGRGAVSVVMDALRDPSDKVRYQALYRAVLVGALPPEDTMIDLVLNDSSEQVKVWAFQTLPLDPTLRWVALRASNDSSHQLAELARNFLKDLDGSTGGAMPGEAPQIAPQATRQAAPSAAVQTTARRTVVQPEP